MDSQWNSSSFVEGTLECLLCRDIVDYVKGNRSAYIDHLKNVHKAKIHHNLMLAVTFMDNKSLQNVINQFEESSKELGSNSGDESLLKENEDDPDEPSTIKDFGENEDTSKSVDAVDVKTLNSNKEGNDCEQCDKSFSSRAALNKHVSKNHESNEKRKTPNEDNENEAPPAKSPKLSKESSKGVETITSKPIEYEYILANSKFFKANPKQITSKCNTNLHNMDVFTLVDSSLPDGWKYREHTKPDGNVEKHYLAPDGRVIKSKKAVLEYLDVIDKHAAEQSGENYSESDTEEKEAPKRLGDLKGRLASLSIERKPKGDSAIEKTSKEDSENTQQSQPKKRGRPSLSSKVNQQNDKEKENKSEDDSEKVSEVKKRRSGVDKKDSKSKDDDSDMKKRRSGVGTECPECHKVVSMPKQHMEDMHSPPGHFPCRGCKKVFTSKNKESSHYSRHCNPNKKK